MVDRNAIVIRAPGQYMKSLIHLLLAVWLAFVVLAVRAEIPSEQVKQYIALSGIGEMLESMPRQIDFMIDQLVQASENPEQERELMQALAGAWSPAAARASVEDFIRASSDSGEIDQLLRWKVGPLAKKMMAAEMASYAPGFQEDLARFVEGLQDAPPDEETSKAIRRLITQAQLADMMVESTVQVTEAMASALVDAGMFESEDSLADLQLQLDSMRAQLRPRMERQATLLSLYIYRNASIEELEQYADFYESDLGKRELALAYGSLEVAVSLWAKEATRALAAGPGETN